MTPSSGTTRNPTVRRAGWLARTTAALAAVGCAVLWATFAWANPYGELDGSAPRLIGMAMIVVWMGGLVALYREIVPWVYVTSVLALVPIGLYLLGTPGLFAWIGVLTLVYLAAGIVWQRSRPRSRS